MSRSRRRGLRTYRVGSTYVEMAVVVLVMGIAGSITVPRLMEHQQRQRSLAAAKQLASDLKGHRNWALSNSNAWVVQFFPAESAYVMVGIPDSHRPHQSFRVDLNHRYGVQFKDAGLLAGRFSPMLVTPPEIAFNGYGVPNAAASVTVVCGKHEATVTLSASGQVSGP